MTKKPRRPAPGAKPSSAALLAGYQEVGGIYRPQGEIKEFGYSDGEVQEEYLYQAVTQAADRSLLSPELRRAIRDWPSTYHLSPKRANLLRPFAAALRGRVLEIGAGCGALTRFLGENGGDIVALEASPRRARIARERTKDLHNVAVVADRIEDFPARGAFDAAVVVGVLEYCRVYMKDAAAPEQAFLSHVGGCLADDGVLILAIENKLGLKYFAGAPEDHFGAPFSGINDNYTGSSPVTFGRAELGRLLAAAGFEAQRWYVPCPDYKLPSTVLSPGLLSGYPDLAETLLAQSSILDPQRPPDPAFSLEQAWSVLEQNGLVEQFANSFLVVAARSATALKPFDREPALAWHFTVDRHPAFAKETLFVARQGSLAVERRRLGAAAPPSVPVDCVIESEPFVAGANWWRALVTILNTPDWTVRQLADWAAPWLDAVRKEGKLETFDAANFRGFVGGRLFDATPFNLIRTPAGAFRFIDQEWRMRPDIELGFVVFRGLLGSMVRVTSVAPPATGTPASIHLLIAAILAELGIMATRIELDRFALLDWQAQRWVLGELADDAPDEWLAGTRNVALRIRAPLERAALIGARDAAVAERDGAGARFAGELAAVRDEAGRHAADRDRFAAELDSVKPAQDELLARKAQFAATEQALAQSRNETAEAREEADRRAAEHDRLAAELEQERAALAQSGAQAASLAIELEAQRAAVHARDAAVADGERRLAELAAQLAAAAPHEARAQSLAQELDAQRAALQARDEAAARLDAELKAAQSAAAAHKSEAEAAGAALKSAQAVVKDRDGAVARLIRDLDAARNYLRESQTQVQRLTGELDGARAEAKRGAAERTRLLEIAAAGAAELDAARARLMSLQGERDGLQTDASLLPALRAQVEALRDALAQARNEADRRERAIAESAARLAAAANERDRLAAELEQAKEAARRAERSTANRIAALDAQRAAALAESENKARTQVRALRDQLVAAEAALAKSERERRASLLPRLPSGEKRRARRAIARSGLFDADWYVREYPDAGANGRSPIDHYLEEGYLRGCRPNPLFDTRWYLETYEDVRRAGINPLLHYIRNGTREGRDPGPDFHTDFYLVSNPDVRANGMNPLRHYLRYGRDEGRAATRSRGNH